MDRLKGLASFLATTLCVLLGARLVHVMTPVVFPETRIGPIAVATLADVRRVAGFRAIVPAYRPAILGERPVNMAVQLSPNPAFMVSWRSDRGYLSVTQSRGTRPPVPPVARPFEDVPDAVWWTDGLDNHLIIAIEDFWIALDTSLSARELRRFVDTLS